MRVPVIDSNSSPASSSQTNPRRKGRRCDDTGSRFEKDRNHYLIGLKATEKYVPDTDPHDVIHRIFGGEVSKGIQLPAAATDRVCSESDPSSDIMCSNRRTSNMPIAEGVTSHQDAALDPEAVQITGAYRDSQMGPPNPAAQGCHGHRERKEKAPEIGGLKPQPQTTAKRMDDYEISECYLRVGT